MNVDTLYNIFESNIDSVITAENLAIIATRNFNTSEVSFVNRVLIMMQNKYATSFRSEQAWAVIGRKLKCKCSPIWIADNIVNVKYFDVDTDEEIKDLDLSSDEISQAVRLGTIRREADTSGLRAIPIYSIKDTETFDADAYQDFCDEHSKSIKVSSLLSIAYREYGIKCVGGSKSTFDKANNTLFIGKDSYEDKISAAVLAIAYTVYGDALIDDESDEVIHNIGKVLLAQSVISYYSHGKSVDEEEFSSLVDSIPYNTSSEHIVDILSVYYELAGNIINLIDHCNTSLDDSKLKKASELLDILEANDAYQQIRG